MRRTKRGGQADGEAGGQKAADKKRRTGGRKAADRRTVDGWLKMWRNLPWYDALREAACLEAMPRTGLGGVRCHPGLAPLRAVRPHLDRVSSADTWTFRSDPSQRSAICSVWPGNWGTQARRLPRSLR